MKSRQSNLTRYTGVTGFLATLALAANIACAQEADEPLTVRTDGLPQGVGARLIEKGQQGITALSQYLNRTRAVHNLTVADVVKTDGQGRVVRQPAHPAVAVADPDK